MINTSVRCSSACRGGLAFPPGLRWACTTQMPGACRRKPVGCKAPWGLRWCGARRPGFELGAGGAMRAQRMRAAGAGQIQRKAQNAGAVQRLGAEGTWVACGG